MALDPKMVAELAELGIMIIDIGNPRELHEILNEVFQEEHQLDYLEHKQNQEWNHE